MTDAARHGVAPTLIEPAGYNRGVPLAGRPHGDAGRRDQNFTGRSTLKGDAMAWTGSTSADVDRRAAERSPGPTTAPGQCDDVGSAVLGQRQPIRFADAVARWGTDDTTGAE